MFGYCYSLTMMTGILKEQDEQQTPVIGAPVEQALWSQAVATDPASEELMMTEAEVTTQRSQKRNTLE